MVYKHAYLNTLLLLHATFMLSLVKMQLKGRLEAMHEIVMEITLLIMENHGIVFLNFCGNPDESKLKRTHRVILPNFVNLYPWL